MADFSSIDTLASAMTFHRDRHAVLAGNIANVDTPGYRPLDLMRSTPASADGSLPLAGAGPAHLDAPAEAPTVQAFDDGGALPGPDGNAVSLERELAKIDANRTRYSVNSELVSRRFAMLRYAAGAGA